MFVGEISALFTADHFKGNQGRQKTKIMASSPFTSWQIDGETMETI